jgi:hypothetical protein
MIIHAKIIQKIIPLTFFQHFSLKKIYIVSARKLTISKFIETCMRKRIRIFFLRFIDMLYKTLKNAA